MKVVSLILSAASVAACEELRAPADRNSETVFLSARDHSIQHDQSSARPAVSTQGGVVNRIVPSAQVNDPLRTRRRQLRERIEELTNEEADSACLTMELIPREQIFDRSIKPKQILLRYINGINSAAELDSLERVLIEPRR